MRRLVIQSSQCFNRTSANEAFGNTVITAVGNRGVVGNTVITVFQQVSSLYQGNVLRSHFIFLGPPSRRGAQELMKKPCHPAVNNVALLVPLRSIHF